MSRQNTTVDSIIENLINIHPLLSKNLSSSIRNKTNLNPGSLFILGLLTRYEILSMSEIGCKLSIPKPHVTAQIDKLINEEMVERVFDPNDRRIINIRMTEKGVSDFRKIKLDLTVEMRQSLNKLDITKLAELEHSTAQVRMLLSEIMGDNTSDVTSCDKNQKNI